MPKNEFAELFKGLTNEEFSQFGKFIRSPFFDVPNRIVKLFDIIESKFDSLAGTPLSREEISEYFYPGKSFSDTQLNIRKLISEFKNYYNGFLSELEFSRQKFQRDWFLLKQLAKREKYDEFDKEFDKANIALESMSIKNEEYYQYKINLLDEAYKAESTDFKKFEEDLAFKIQELLDLYYFGYKLSMVQRIESRAYVMSENVKDYGRLVEEIMKEIEENEEYFKPHPEVYMRYFHYKYFLHGIDKRDLEKFYIYANGVKSKYNIDCFKYYIDLLYYCIRESNLGNPEYEKIFLDITEKMDMDGEFFKHGIPTVILKAVVESAIGQKRFDWALNFMDKYRSCFSTDSSGYIFLSQAKLYFFMGKFDLCRKYLIKVGYGDFIHYVDAKLIEVRINYEENSITEALTVLDTVYKYIKSHKEIGKFYSMAYLKFVVYMKELIRLKEHFKLSSNEFDIVKLTGEINNEKIVYGKDWLTEKVKEIK